MVDGYNTIQDFGVNQFLTRRLNTTSGPASSLAPEVMPIVPALRWDSSADWVAGLRRCGSRATLTAGGGQFAGFRVRNPRAAGVICVLESMVVSVGAASSIDYGLTDVNADLSASINPSAVLDGRQPMVPAAITQTTAVVSTISTAATPAFTTNGVPTGAAAMPAATALVIPLGYVLSPGVNFDVWSQVGQTIRVALVWTERRAQPSELV